MTARRWVLAAGAFVVLLLVGSVVQNAFFKAILPSFDAELRRPRRQ